MFEHSLSRINFRFCCLQLYSNVAINCKFVTKLSINSNLNKATSDVQLIKQNTVIYYSKCVRPTSKTTMNHIKFSVPTLFWRKKTNCSQIRVECWSDRTQSIIISNLVLKETLIKHIRFNFSTGRKLFVGNSYHSPGEYNLTGIVFVPWPNFSTIIIMISNRIIII